MEQELLIEIKELQSLYIREEYTVVVFGTLEYGQRVRKALEGFGIKVSFFADNNAAKWHGVFEGLGVIPPADIPELRNPLVVCASFWYQRIRDQLRQMGVERVYTLMDCPVNTEKEMEADRDELENYFKDYDRKRSDKVLIEVYGHMGDVFVKTGVCKTFIDEYGLDNIYFWVDETEQQGMAAYLSLISPNVFIVDRNRFSEDREYRLHLLEELNSKYFQYTYILCDARLSFKKRCIGRLNLNATQLYWAYEENYVLDKDCKLMGGILGKNVSQACRENNTISQEIQKITLDFTLPERFVAIGMGADNQYRRYPASRFKAVFDYLLGRDYYIVFLGYGKYDEDFYEELTSGYDCGQRVINMISRLSILESIAVINKSLFYVGADSGLWNATCVLGKSSVVIYGRGDEGHFEHNMQNVQYVKCRMPRCSWCQYWDCSTDMPINGVAPCVYSISPEYIIVNIQKLEQTIANFV